MRNAGILLLAAAVCSQPGPLSAEPLSVFVTIMPQQFLVERIGGGRVTVEALVKPGQNHEVFEPPARLLARLAGSRAYFRIGLPFEAGLVPRLEGTMKGLRIVDAAAGIALRDMEDDGHGEGEAGGDHRHEGKDPHTWLSPALALKQARTVAAALIDLDPAGRADYERNLAALATDLDDLDRRLAAILAPVRGRTMLVFHPAWGYFADAYGLRQKAVEVEGKAPGARQLARFVDESKALGTRTIFVEPQVGQRFARTVADAIGGRVLPIDPMAKDYVANLERVAALVRDALQQEAGK